MGEFERAVEALREGRAVIFPTDTVYGLGVAVRHAASPQELFDLKRRSADKPVAWLVGSADDLDRYGRDVSDEARELAAGGWPGALTLIVKASDEVPSAFRSAEGTIGLRMPDSDAALALIRAVGPIATTSANLSGQPAPAAFQDIAPELRCAVATIEAEHPLPGIPSAVIDCVRGPAQLLR